MTRLRTLFRKKNWRRKGFDFKATSEAGETLLDIRTSAPLSLIIHTAGCYGNGVIFKTQWAVKV